MGRAQNSRNQKYINELKKIETQMADGEKCFYIL